MTEHGRGAEAAPEEMFLKVPWFVKVDNSAEIKVL